MDTAMDATISDIFLELMEVALNLILFVRNIYPEGIFQRVRKYNIGVMMNRHPDLIAYVKGVFESMKPLVDQGVVEKVVIQISDKNDIPLERFNFEVKLMTQNSNSGRQVAENCYFNMETHLRALLLKINTSEALLKPLPEDCSFKVLVHTTESSLKTLEDNSNFQLFPWVVAENNCKELIEDAVIVPIRSCSTNAIMLTEFYLFEKHLQVQTYHKITSSIGARENREAFACTRYIFEQLYS